MSDPRTSDDLVLVTGGSGFIGAHVVVSLLDAGHRVAIICFREYLSAQLAELEDRGLKIVDLEYDVGAFNQMLHRIYPIDLRDFDPVDYL